MFDIFIVTWNNIAYLRQTIESIHKNSYYDDHRIFVHINDGSDGTYDWVRYAAKEKERPIWDWTCTNDNIGLCKGANMLTEPASTFSPWKNKYICLMDDDLYLLPNWDKQLYDFRTDNKFGEFDWVSSTMIEPTPGPVTTVSPYNYGKHPSNLQEDTLLDQYDNFVEPDRHMVNIQSTPVLLTRDAWTKVGGYNEAFSPGIGSEEALAKQLYDLGGRNFVSIGTSLVYHFQTITTDRLTNRHEHGANRETQFEKQFNMTSKEFRETQLKWRTKWEKRSL